MKEFILLQISITWVYHYQTVTAMEGGLRLRLSPTHQRSKKQCYKSRTACSGQPPKIDKTWQSNAQIGRPCKLLILVFLLTQKGFNNVG